MKSYKNKLNIRIQSKKYIFFFRKAINFLKNKSFYFCYSNLKMDVLLKKNKYHLIYLNIYKLILFFPLAFL